MTILEKKPGLFIDQEGDPGTWQDSNQIRTQPFIKPFHAFLLPDLNYDIRSAIINLSTVIHLQSCPDNLVWICDTSCEDFRCTTENEDVGRVQVFLFTPPP